MNANEVVVQYRTKPLIGLGINLVPFCERDSEDVVKLRNEETNRYFFSQQRLYDVQGQKLWYERYLKTDNDLFWTIRSKNDKFVGMMRVYDIDSETYTCEQGTLAINKEEKDANVYAIEAFVLSLDFCFDKLEMRNVIHIDKTDNKIMNSLSRKLGGGVVDTVKFNNNDYYKYVITDDRYRKKRLKFEDEIRYYWESRCLR